MPSGAAPPALTPYPVDRVPPALRGAVVAIGNFDGMHAGHRALIAEAKREAETLARPSLVLTFEPHPRTVFRPADPVFRLTPLAAKAHILFALEVDGLAYVPFDPAFAANPPATFVADYLVGHLGIAHAVVGHDFHYGKGRAGDAVTLRQAGAEAGFGVTVVDEVRAADGTSFSSSAVRGALAAGDVATANRLLGYRWFAVGAVVAGAKRGRALGFPTANIALGTDCKLRHGIYAVRVERADGTLHDGVANFGRRPTFDDGPPLLEVWLFDFDGDLYGETLAVSLIDWIRPEAKFESVEALVAEVGRDAAKARQILASTGPGTALDRALARPK
jgi:riboflavin kinase/FMN adenylyltransferase